MAESPLIALTVGEPAGIGPDLALQYAASPQNARLIALADPVVLEQRQQKLGTSIRIIVRQADQPIPPHKPGELWVEPSECPHTVEAGQLNPGNASYVLETIRKATLGCMRGTYHAMVTGPVHKGVINDAGHRFSGHTEFIAEICGGYPVMMLACPGLRVALATTHLPLSQVAESITPDTLTNVVDHLIADLSLRFGIAKPRVLVCGLNPHAGESGHMGREEIEIITPVLDEFRACGHQLEGPLPADTLFTPNYLERADAVLAMYHDQGLPVLKHMGFGEAVNITLGLPVIRTSVDHGTALDLAGSGRTRTGSLEAAIATARTMAINGG